MAFFIALSGVMAMLNNPPSVALVIGGAKTMIFCLDNNPTSGLSYLSVNSDYSEIGTVKSSVKAKEANMKPQWAQRNYVEKP